MRKEGYQVPQVEFVFRENGEFVNPNPPPPTLSPIVEPK